MKKPEQNIPLSAVLPLLEEGLSQGRTVELVPTGISMRPLLEHKKSPVHLAAGQPYRGAVVLVRRDNGSYVLHRIIGKKKDGTYTLCGDNQWQPEYGIRREQILGIMTDFYRNGRRHSCEEFSYRIYWHFRLLLRPVRSAKRKTLAFLSRLRRVIKEGKYLHG